MPSTSFKKFSTRNLACNITCKGMPLGLFFFVIYNFLVVLIHSGLLYMYHLQKKKKYSSVCLSHVFTGNVVFNLPPSLQHPANCRQAKRLVRKVTAKCGYGCEMHHFLPCFVKAYYTGRTFVLDTHELPYSTQGLSEFFQPLSPMCTSHEGRDDRKGGETQH